ncbi:hypothetical protein ES705_46378 [subsurface metagenome]
MSRKGHGKSPYNARKTRVINIPKEFLPLIMDESEQKGYMSSAQMMGEILAEHYGWDVEKWRHLSGLKAEEPLELERAKHVIEPWEREETLPTKDDTATQESP